MTGLTGVESAMVAAAFTLIGIFINNEYQRRRQKAANKVKEQSSYSNTVKTLAEAYNINVNSEILIAAKWKEIAEEVAKQAKEQIMELEVEIARERMDCNKKISDLQLEVTHEKIDCDQKISVLQRQINDLKNNINL